MTLFRIRIWDPHLGCLAALLLLLSAFWSRTPDAYGAMPPRETAGKDPALPLLEVDLASPGSWGRLIGLDLDFLLVRQGYRARVLGWPGTRGRLDDAGLSYRVATPDYGRELAARITGLRKPVLTPSAWSVPAMGQGSLGGFWNLDEVYALMDSLAGTDVEGIVTGVDTIGTSLQGRPILALGITDMSRPLGTRPEVLFTALTHAREPEGMQTILHFMIRLLDQYGVDPVLTYLVNERETWFVPVVNPDGYVRNENTWLDTGSFGFWRKNLRNNDANPNITNKDGVDLNRNFGYQWGYDDSGSSSQPGSQTYRGTGPFSEPETQVIRDFCNAHSFRTANNYHAYWETVLYPWAYVSGDTPDSAAYIYLGDALSEQSAYSYGRSAQILYPVNGDSDDWMYGEQTSKPKTFAFTSEVGNQNDGFWPPVSRIVLLAKNNFDSNVVMAYAAGVYLTADAFRIDSTDGFLAAGETHPARVKLRHKGVAGTTIGGITVTATSGHPDVTLPDDTATYPDLGSLATVWPEANDGFVVSAGPLTAPGTLVPLYLEITDHGGYVGRDTVEFRVGLPVSVFADSGDSGLSNWTAEGSWELEEVDGDSVFSDSPGTPYLNDTDASLMLDQALNLSGAVNAVLRFRTQWDVEGGYDFATVELSTDAGGSWTPLAGRHTRPGHGSLGNYNGGVQPLNQPGYDGNQRLWEYEEFDLSAYTGLSDLRIRFRMASDGGVTRDGWFVDDIVVLAYAPMTPVGVGFDPEIPAQPVLTAVPNPFGGRTRISYAMDHPGPIRISVYDVSGREVRVLSHGLSQRGEVVWDGMDSLGRPAPAGAYFVKLRNGKSSAATKVIITR